MTKKIIIWLLELAVPLAIPIVIISLPLSFILELFPSLSKYENIFIYTGLIIILIVFSIVREYLQKKKIISNFIEKITSKKNSKNQN